VDPELARQVPSETVVYSVRHDLRGPIGLFLKFHAPIMPWLPKAWWACLRAIRRHKPEVVLTSGPPHQVHLLGLVLKRQFDIPWVADFRDPWVAGVESFGRAARPRGRWDARFEAAVMDGADVIIANTPRNRDLIQQAYPLAAGKMLAVTNGYDPEPFASVARSLRRGDHCRIVHAGQLYAGRDPRPFLDAIKDLEHQRPAGYRPVQVHFLGNLDRPDCDVSAEIRTRGLLGVVNLDGIVPYQRSLREMVQSDILLLLDSPGRTAGVPAKVYEYIGAGRPILALGESCSDLGWVLQESGVPHRISPLEDPARIKQSLIELQAEPLRDPESNGLPAGAVFTREYITGELARILDCCAQRQPLITQTKPEMEQRASAVPASPCPLD
jgi:glycosyltransferase involved in cell wall biosynthesis